MAERQIQEGKEGDRETENKMKWQIIERDKSRTKRRGTEERSKDETDRHRTREIRETER